MKAMRIQDGRCCRWSAIGLGIAAWLLASATLVWSTGHAAENDTVGENGHAVIFMYHRFGEGAHPSTNVTLDQLDAHIKELSSGKYNVRPLPEIISALRQGRVLADRTVGISIDDAYLSVYREAWPRFRKAGLPFTVFIATDPVDRGVRGYMNWNQLRELKDAGVSLGSQTATHLHMAAATADANRRDMVVSNGRFRVALGAAPALFAYPYGENSLAARTVIKDAGFSAAFGQHSGVIGGGQDLFYLPRFALNEAYGSLERLRLAANALPFPVSDVTPIDHLITAQNPPLIGFTAGMGVQRLGRLSCFTSHEGRVRLEMIGRRIEVRATNAFPSGRTRLNCTLPAADGRWHWYGRQFYRSE